MRFFSSLIASAILVPLCAGGALAATAASRDDTRVVPPGLADRDGNRLSDALEARLDGMGADDPVDVIVTFAAPGLGVSSAQRAVGPFSVHAGFTIIDGFAARMTAGQARALARLPQVRRVEDDVMVHASDINALRDFKVDQVHAPTLDGGLGIAGAGVGICIIDTGIHGIHEQFNDAGTSKIAGWIDFVNRRADPYDDNGHGSHVSNIAAGDGTGFPADEAALFIGVAPAADLYGAKVLDAAGSGRVRNVIRGVEWCAAQPTVHVINLSLGSDASSDGTDALSAAIDNAVDIHGKTVVVAAGNAGATPATVGTPAAARRAITVGAVADWSASVERRDWWSAGPYLTPFSGRGPTADGRTKPDVVGPGHTIAAAYIDPWGGLLCTTDCYTVLSGTSMASPFVAGVVALMVEAGGGTMSPEDVRQIIFETAHPRGPVAGKDNDWGFGMIDPWSAVNRAGGASLTSYAPAAFPAYRHGAGSVPDGGLFSIDLEVLDPTQPFAVTVTIDGALVRSSRITAWLPDLEARLRKLDGSDAAFWLFLDSSTSRCPAIGAECGRYGRQETLFLAPPLAPAYRLQVWPANDTFNQNRGGSFVFEIANGRIADRTDLVPAGLTADAGADVNVRDDDGDGFAAVELDGSASGPFGTIVTYLWSWTDTAGGHAVTGMAPTVSLPTGTHSIWLTVTDTAGASASDMITATVAAGGGNGGGGPKAKGKGAAGDPTLAAGP